MSLGILLDTNILIDYLRNVAGAVRYLENTEEPLAVSALTVAELHRGTRNNRECAQLTAFLEAFRVIPADEAVCRLGGRLCAKYGPSHGTDLIDAIIAATARTHALPLATMNKKHFPMLKNVRTPYRLR